MSYEKLLKESHCSAVCLSIPLTFTLFIMYIGLSHYTGGSSVAEADFVLDHLKANLNTAPIQDIIIVEGFCPSGYQETQLGYWPGNNPGCLVRGVVKNECETNITTYEQVAPSNSTNSTQWGNGTYNSSYANKSNATYTSGNNGTTNSTTNKTNSTSGNGTYNGSTNATNSTNTNKTNSTNVNKTNSTSTNKTNSTINHTLIIKVGDPIPAHGALPINNWGSKKFCVKRNSNFKYDVDSCPTGMKRCTKSLCVANAEFCPITELEITNTYQTGGKTGDAISYQNFTNNRSLKVSRKTDGQPIIRIQATPNDVPCFYGGFIPARPNRDYHSLIKGTYGCGQYGEDENAVILDEKTELDVYTSNGYGSIMNNISNYTSKIQYSKMVLSYTTRVELENKQVCMQDLNKNNAQDAFAALSGYATLAGVEVFLQIVLLVVLIWGVCLYTSEPFDAESKGPWYCGGAIWILSLVFFVMIFAGLGSKAKELTTGNTAFDVLKNNNCLQDKIYISAIDHFNAMIRDAPTQIANLVNEISIVTVIQVVLVAGVLIWRKVAQPAYVQMP